MVVSCLLQDDADQIFDLQHCGIPKNEIHLLAHLEQELLGIPTPKIRFGGVSFNVFALVACDDGEFSGEYHSPFSRSELNRVGDQQNLLTSFNQTLPLDEREVYYRKIQPDKSRRFLDRLLGFLFGESETQEVRYEEIEDPGNFSWPVCEVYPRDFALTNVNVSFKTKPAGHRRAYNQHSKY